MSTVLFLPYFSSVAWMAVFLKSENACIEAHDNFQKSTSRNRTVIAAANGLQHLSIPLVGGRDTHRLYGETKISYTENWQKNHWRSIVSTYNRSPFFEHYAYLFEPFYTQKHEQLFKYNSQLLNTILQVLKANKEISFTEQYDVNFYTQDFRKNEPELNLPRYWQVFEDRNGFQPKVSVLDLIFNMGPQALAYLNKLEVVP